MIAMEFAEWRRYRCHSIVARRGGLLGRRRWEVWDRGSLIGSFRDMIGAELHVDALLGQAGSGAR
jgi:hypothetical protein